MAGNELRKLVIAVITAAVLPAVIIISTWAVWHSVPAARHLVATSGEGPVPSGAPAGSPAGRAATGAGARAAPGPSAVRPQAGRTVSVPREIRAAAPGETERAEVIHVAVAHAPVPPPGAFEIGPVTPKPDVSLVCGTCRGNVLEVNF